MSRTTPRTRLALFAGALLAVVALGVAAVAASASDDAGFRTARAEVRDVQQVLESVGTVEPVSQAAVSFPTSGTVEAVYVEVGDTVTTGSPLADLDASDLERNRREAQAALDQADLVLALALAGEDVSGVTGGGTPSGGFGRALAGPDIGAAQEAVVAAQAAVDAAMADAQAALANAASVCASTSTAPTTTTTTTTSAPATTSASDATSEACLAALNASLAAQEALAQAQEDLDAAVEALTALLEAEASEEPSDGSPTTEVPSGEGEAATGQAPSGGGVDDASAAQGVPSGESAGTTSSSPSAEDLIAYQKAVDAAALDVVVAQQAVEQATIVSPVAGTVVAVGIDVGDEVTAASSTQAITVVADGGFEVTTTVSVTDLPAVAVGQAATVVPDGEAEPVEGEVVRVGVTPDASSATPTYDLTIGLTGDTSSLRNGSTASVAIVTAAVGEALAVPTSAVAIDGDRATVDVLDGGEAVATEVEVGAVGQRWIEVTDGLAEGDVVVLADLDEPLPGSATDGSSVSIGGAGGFGGFGGPGG